MSSNLKVNSLVPATGTEIGIGTTGGSIDFRCPATFGGNVTIGGTLTYDEVINIDSIGIVTARSGLKVTGGQLDVGSNIKAGNAGVITATTFSGSGASLTGLTAGQIPNLAASKITSGTVATARLGSGTASSSTFLRGDGSWAATGAGTGEQFVKLKNSSGALNNGGENVYAGYRAGASLASGGAENTFYGTDAGRYTATADYNTYIGHRAGENSTVSSNTAVGAESLRNNTSGSGNNTAVGQGAAQFLTSASDSIAIGYHALKGANGSNPVTGVSNIAIGAYAGDAMKAGSQNVLIGQNCGGAMVSSHWNVAIGKDCADSATGLGNVILGHDAGRATSGNYNVVLGKAAGDVGSFSGANNIIIGYNADPTSASTSNEITLGNSDISNLRIPGLNYYNVGGSIGVNEATPDFSGFGGNGGGIELDDVNTGFTAVKLSQSGTDLYLVAHSGAAYISTRTNKEIVIEKNSTEVAKFTDNGLKFPNGKGIDFSANTDAGGTSSATLLEDYESGSYTSSIVSSNCTLDNSSGTGYYIKVGNMVYVRGLFSMNTQSGSPSKSGTDNIVQALPYAIKSGTTSMTGTMIVENINSGAPTSSVGHPLWYNVLPSGFVCLAGSNGIRFYINKIEAAYTRMNNSHLNVGYPGYTWMSWNIVYETN